ncbi:hypothetical protein MKW94_011873 [Papaver nudicaule]|uniref:RING-type E3 ubiquitin transferase n=1 Tax=Papaver nudicaule TaxID=74823 RepID=A0AA41SI11_PAPNU|nr:hypothetical protein [Papaver nudicaule]
MQNRVGNESSQSDHPSSPTSQDLDQQDSNRSNQRRRIDAAIDNNSVEEDVPYGSDNGVGTEEESTVSTEGRNSNNQEVSSLVTIQALLQLSLDVGSQSMDDIDGLTYEEMLELDRMGLLQRGLSKETISSHLKTRVRITTSVDSAEKETGICTICQDGYANKDKIGSLDCRHEYREDCITRWLAQKNVCPICKRQGLVIMEENKIGVNVC